MDIIQESGKLSVKGLRELNSANAHSFRAALATALSHDLRTIEIDLSQTQTVDGAGLGALVALHETANQHRNPHAVTLRLTNPTATVQQMLELARLHHLFEIAPSGGKPDGALPRAAHSLHETDSSAVHLH
jgi:anti-anti-sigma factor